MRFRDRSDAGRQLGERLSVYAGRSDAVVLALPRGGVPVGHEVAARLNVPLDVVLVRKLGVPGQPELAMGAIAEGGVEVLSRGLIRDLAIPAALVEQIAVRARIELERRDVQHRSGRSPHAVRDRIVILVDDGLATGLTMEAAVTALRQHAPARIVVAAPVGARDTCEHLRRIADEVVCLSMPEPFTAVGFWYDEFSQTSDEEVQRLLATDGATMSAAGARHPIVRSAGGAVLLVTMAGLFATSPSAQGPSTASPADSRADNYYAAANRVEITAPMPADVVVAGREVHIAQSVAGDILAAGWRVRLAGPAEDDVRIAAGEVVVNAPVTGDLTLAGGEVTVGPQAHVGGRSWITGGNVRIDGTFERDLEIAGANVRIAGEARMPVRIVAETLEILPGARLLAPLTYKGSTTMKVADGAVIDGPVSYERIPEREARRARAFPAVSTVLFTMHLVAAGLLVLIFVPRV